MTRYAQYSGNDNKKNKDAQKKRQDANCQGALFTGMLCYEGNDLIYQGHSLYRFRANIAISVLVEHTTDMRLRVAIFKDCQDFLWSDGFILSALKAGVD